MLSRLYDERVFTSSDDVVFGASASRALLGGGVSRRGDHRRVPGDLPEGDEDDESKSDRSSDEREAPADDELESDDDGEDEDEKKRTAGLKFPLQSPRHIAASQNYLRRRQTRGDGAMSPATRRRHVKQLLDGGHVDGSDGVGVHTGERRGVVTLAPLSKELMPREIHVQYHDRPMELVYLSTGEIRPREECPPGLRLPATTDVRKLLEPRMSPTGKEPTHRHVQRGFDESAASSTVHITRQDKSSSVARSELWQRDRPGAIQTNGDARKRGTRQTENRHGYSADNGVEDAESVRSSDEDKVSSANRHRSATSKTRTTSNNDKRSVHDDTRRTDSPDQQQVERHDNRSAPITSNSTLRRDRDDHASEDEKVEEDRTRHSRHSKSSADRKLEVDLQREKRRVLEKMTQLLEEQGKTQALQLQLQLSQDKVATLEKELESYARRGSREENNHRERDERVHELLKQVQAKDELILRLQSQLEQVGKSVTNQERQDKNSPKYEDKIARLRQREAAIAKQLEDLMNRVTDFHSQVECWKVNSREALEGCDKRADVLELMDRLWMDFPPFISSSESAARKTTGDSESSTITFLTKKLRQKEEELRNTHVKYVELKELCARQCIREADLQNFINEHRLRGNLVIRKNNNVANNGAELGREGGKQQHRSNGQTNAMDEPHYGNQDTDSNDGDDSDPGGDRIVQRPRVFIDIKRSNQRNGHQQEPSPIEHVRLAPSPALAQRYRQQQHQQHDEQQASVRQSTSRTAQSGRTTRAATVSSASRTLATTRHTLTSRASTTQKRAGTRAPGSGRSPSIVSKTPSTRASTTSRRPSQVTLTSRPWV